MLVKWQNKWQWIVYYLTNQFTSLNIFIMSNSTLKLTSDQTQLLQQMFGDLASLDYDDKYNDGMVLKVLIGIIEIVRIPLVDLMVI